MVWLHKLIFRGSQRWIYRIDPKRVNEYGQVMATDIDAAKSQEESKRKKKAE